MRLAILDTNVVVSAGLKLSSVPFQLVGGLGAGGAGAARACPSIVSEYREVLLRPKFTRHGFPPAWLEQLIEESLRLPDPPPWTHSVPDAKDAIFLALAHASGAWLVTGNLKHFQSLAVTASPCFRRRVSRSPRGMKVLSRSPNARDRATRRPLDFLNVKPIAGPYPLGGNVLFYCLIQRHQVSRQWPEWRSSQPLPRYYGTVFACVMISEVQLRYT